VFSCDYNGWADVPEEEREGIDAFEATNLPSAASRVFMTEAVQALQPPALGYPTGVPAVRRAA
jgi:hypothetical protein